jgi:hypothetical protein
MDNVDDEQEAQWRRHWRLLWLSSIQAFSDAETQKARWLDTGNRNPYFSFVECMCSYFDDANLGEENAFERRLASGYLTPEEIEATAEFHALAAGYDSPSKDDYDHATIINDPAWIAVVDSAQAAKARLLALITDDEERRTLSTPVHWEERDGAFYADALGSRIVPASQWVAEQSSTRLRACVAKLLGKLRGKAGR